MTGKKEEGLIIGIDFGTCYSSIAIMQGLIPVTSFIDDHGSGIPSLFMYSDDEGRELFGFECETANPHENPNVIKYMKRKVREDSANIDKPCPSGENEYLLRDVIEKYVAFLIKTAKDAALKNGEFLNTNIEAMTITTPIGIADGQMMATDYNKLIKDTMVKITGLSSNKVNVVGEPVAAAISYLYEKDAHKKYDDNQTILVFDLGGGTLDVTLIKHDPHAVAYEILDKEGDLQLGGKDWDDELGKLLMSKAGIKSIESEKERGMFWDTVTELKISLSKHDEDIKRLKIAGNKVDLECTRDEFENATKHLLDRAMDVVKKAISTIDGGIGSIDKIVMVGGSSNMPQIKRRMCEEYADFNQENILLYDPSKAIAKGAAIYSYLRKEGDDDDDNNGIVHNPSIIDVATNSYGFESQYHGTESRIYNLIFKGTKFDKNRLIQKRSDSSFRALKNSQTAVTFRVYESQWLCSHTIGSPDDKIDDKDDEWHWMDFGNGEVLNGMEVTVQIPPEFLGKASSYSVWPEFLLDQDGILEITIFDKDNNKVGYARNRL